MLAISPEAAEIIRKQGGAVFLDLPRPIASCCFDFRECPTVRFGRPDNTESYGKVKVGDITVFVPAIIIDIDLSIEVAAFLGFKRLIIEGWRYC
jgi:hypothetical protein